MWIILCEQDLFTFLLQSGWDAVIITTIKTYQQKKKTQRANVEKLNSSSMPISESKGRKKVYFYVVDELFPFFRSLWYIFFIYCRDYRWFPFRFFLSFAVASTSHKNERKFIKRIAWIICSHWILPL
jgi:hypothetical protein